MRTSVKRRVSRGDSSFLTSQIVVFDTKKRVNTPKELLKILPHISSSSIFYHVIDARRRTPDNRDDFQAWLAGFGDKYHDLIEMIGSLDPYFPTLTELRKQILMIFKEYFAKKKK